MKSHGLSIMKNIHTFVYFLNPPLKTVKTVAVFICTLSLLLTTSCKLHRAPSVDDGLPTSNAPTRILGITFPTTVVSGVSNLMIVTAQDSANILTPNYIGTVTFSSSDGTANLPTNYIFTTSDHGVHIFSATLNVLGLQSITATDT